MPPMSTQKEQLETVNLALDLLNRLGGSVERIELLFRDYVVNTTLKGDSSKQLAPTEHYEILFRNGPYR